MGTPKDKKTRLLVENLPIYGKGKDNTNNFWKELAVSLIHHGFLYEVVTDLYTTYGITSKGETFLDNYNIPDREHLILPITKSMIKEQFDITKSISQKKRIPPYTYSLILMTQLRNYSHYY